MRPLIAFSLASLLLSTSAFSQQSLPGPGPALIWNLSGSSAYYIGGSVGIGISAPAAPLHVKYSTANSTSAVPAVIIDNPVGGSQSTMVFASNGNFKASVRGDSSGNLNLGAAGGGIFIGTTDLGALGPINFDNGLFLISSSGNISHSGSVPVVSSCGTSPTIDGHATNSAGTVTVGTGAAASCTVTFANSGYTTWSHCRVTPQTALATFGYSYTKTVLTVTATSLLNEVFDYDCDGS